jgi:hypothetical protein
MFKELNFIQISNFYSDCLRAYIDSHFIVITDFIEIFSRVLDK